MTAKHLIFALLLALPLGVLAQNQNNWPPPTPYGDQVNEPVYGDAIVNAWQEHNQVVGGRNGMLIHVNCSISGYRGKRCAVVAWFYKQNGDALIDSNGLYCTRLGRAVAAGRYVTPGYETTEYTDLKIFMPYDELHRSVGLHYLACRVGVVHENHSINFLGHTAFQYFTYDRLR